MVSAALAGGVGVPGGLAAFPKWCGAFSPDVENRKSLKFSGGSETMFFFSPSLQVVKHMEIVL